MGVRWNPHDRISALIRKEKKHQSFFPLSLSPSCDTQWDRWGCLWHRKWAKNWICWHCGLWLQPPELWELNLCCESHPVWHSSWDDLCSAEQRGWRPWPGFATLQPPNLFPESGGERRRIFSRWKHSSFKIFIYFCTWLCCILAAACRILSCSMTAHLRHEGSSSLTKDRTLGPCTVRVRSLSHWTTVEIPSEKILENTVHLLRFIEVEIPVWEMVTQCKVTKHICGRAQMDIYGSQPQLIALLFPLSGAQSVSGTFSTTFGSPAPLIQNFPK